MRTHLRSKNKPDGNVKTVDIERELDREEYMLKTVGKYIKKTKKKLHQYELTLQNQPDFERAPKSEFIEFDRKLFGNLFAGKHSVKICTSFGRNFNHPSSQYWYMQTNLRSFHLYEKLIKIINWHILIPFIYPRVSLC